MGIPASQMMGAGLPVSEPLATDSIEQGWRQRLRTGLKTENRDGDRLRTGIADGVEDSVNRLLIHPEDLFEWNCSLRRVYLTGEVKKELLYKHLEKWKNNCFRIQ